MARLLKVAESHVSSLEAHAHDVDDLYKQGMVIQSARLSVQVLLLDARQKALQASNGLDLASAAYNRLLGRALDQPVDLGEIAPEAMETPLPLLTERALAQRSELMAMGYQIDALRHQADAVRGENAPQVALSGGYGYQQNRYQTPNGQWMVMLGVKWSLFDGGGTRHRSSAAVRQVSSMAEQRDEAASLIGLQVRQAWQDVTETRKRTNVTQSSIAQAEENLRVARDRYVNGLSQHTEVLDAETLRVNSETNHANAVLDSAIANLRLKRAVGEL